MNPEVPSSPKVSVILPVYNPGPGVEKCIDSLRGQTLKDIEMIFVDDLGTDGSMDKIRAAAAQDARVRILTNEKNLGQGPSRNAGIEAARGEYLSFVDPDDFVAPDFLELLYQRAHGEGLDIVKGSLTKILDGKEAPDADAAWRIQRVIRSGLAQGKPLYALFNCHHQSALYRRDMLLDTGVRYGLSRVSQDTTFLLRVCYAARSFALEDGPLYFYVMRPDSAVHVFSPVHLQGHLHAMREQFAFLSQRLADDPCAVDYAYWRVQEMLRLLDYIGEKEKRYDEKARLVEETRAEVARLPFRDQMADQHVEVRALLQCGLCLPRMPYTPLGQRRSLSDYQRLVQSWHEAVFAHPELFEGHPNDRFLAIDKADFYLRQVMQKGEFTPEHAAFLFFLRNERKRLENGGPQ